MSKTDTVMYLKGCPCKSCEVNRKLWHAVAKSMADKQDALMMGQASQDAPGKDQDHEDIPEH